MAQKMLRDSLQEAEDAISASRYEDALATCQYILAYFPESLEAQRLLGEVYLAQGRLEEAQQSFDWVLTNDPESVIAYCNRALVSERLFDDDTALDCYQQAYELSRGNSQIRQKFNQLSQKTGQQSFMFSRAGLARLYMRGDLLTQAIQEWEAVLASNPERLDARTGLLETYWRDGQTEHVERVAHQLLQDVPGCLKALLLLAHVLFPKDALQAQELLRRAEALDPDLQAAQELFTDLLASQPNDPFLQLLKKAPVLVGTTADVADQATRKTEAASVADPFASLAGAESAAPSSAVAQWGADTSWGNDTTLIKPPAEPALARGTDSWSNEGNNSGESFSELQHLAAHAQNEQTPSGSWSLAGTSAPQASPEPWQALEKALNGLDTGVVPTQSSGEYAWENADTFAKTSQEHSNPWGAPGNTDYQAQESPFASPWALPAQEDGAPAPPAWLSMLTQAERQQISQPMPSLSALTQMPDRDQPTQAILSTPASAIDQPTQAILSTSAIDQLTQAVPPTPVLDQPTQIMASSSVADPSPAEPAAEPQPFWSLASEASPEADGPDMDEDLSFGPAWLKSLGATTLGADEPSMVPEAAEPVAQADQQAWAAPPAQEQTPLPDAASYATWQEPVAQTTSATNDTWGTSDIFPEAQTISPDAWQTPEAQPQSPVHEEWSASSSEPQPEQAAYEPPSVAKDAQAFSAVYEQVAAAYEAWQSSNAESASSEKSVQKEQQLVSTLEELDQQLRSSGFVPMAPNSLSAIAQSEAQKATPAPDLFVDQQQSEEPQPVQPEIPEPTLSSALAELGQYVQRPEPKADAASTPSYQEPIYTQTIEEPSWLQALRSTPTAQPAAASVEQAEPEPVSVFHAPPPIVTTPAPPPMPQELPSTPPVRVEVGPVFNPPPAPAPIARTQAEPLKVPAARSNPLLDGELETTMKRPAVRLQPVALQSRSLPVREPVPATNKGHVSERHERPVSKASDSSISYQERLLKGYQHQLVGDYDEAMQEYRIIIRSAPELLTEVVSNVRALLKLAPRYSAGYRVLGDAYMRQGEYLQAMEAYNKALTMAKKAKN